MGKKILIGFICVLVLSLGIFSYFLFGTYSEGSRAGTLVKLSKKGFVFKTWEGELNTFMFVGDASAASASTPNMFTFSVLSKEQETIDIMDKAMLNGTRIKLFYTERYFKFPWNGETKYFIYKAEVVQK